MGAVWTDEQKKAIKTRDADIIVSAAAGSGGALILRKQAERGVTVAAAQRTVRIALEPAGTECGTDGRQRESAGSYTEQPEGESRK